MVAGDSMVGKSGGVRTSKGNVEGCQTLLTIKNSDDVSVSGKGGRDIVLSVSRVVVTEEGIKLELFYVFRSDLPE